MKKFRTSRWWSNIEALRIDRDLTTKDIARILDKSENYYNTARKNCGMPTVEDALKCADYFGVSVDEIAFGHLGLTIRKKQLEAELARLNEEIEEAESEGAE